LSSPENATIVDAQGIGTIVNDDGAPPPNLSINDVTANEGNSGKTPFTFTISLSRAASTVVWVNVGTAAITATTSDHDYIGVNGKVKMPAGTTSATATVQVNGDRRVEPNEKFAVNLSNPSGATIADGQGLGT